MIKPEILAPAGSPQALIAAVRGGADAVYLGVKSLNARRGAENFDSEQLKEAVAYCHKHNVKVHLTLNTLVSDGELETAQETVRLACNRASTQSSYRISALPSSFTVPHPICRFMHRPRCLFRLRQVSKD